MSKEIQSVTKKVKVVEDRLKGKSVADIASDHGVPVGYVYDTIAEATRIAKERLNKYGDLMLGYDLMVLEKISDKLVLMFYTEEDISLALRVVDRIVKVQKLRSTIIQNHSSKSDVQTDEGDFVDRVFTVNSPEYELALQIKKDMNEQELEELFSEEKLAKDTVEKAEKLSSKGTGTAENLIARIESENLDDDDDSDDD
jgi:hypothetical protein